MASNPWLAVDCHVEQELTYLCLLGGHTAPAQCWNDKRFVPLFSCLFHEEADRQCRLFSVHRLLFWCVLYSLCGYQWMLLFANWTPHSLTLPWSSSWSDELSDSASPELNVFFAEVNPWLYERVWPLWLTHCVNSSCRTLFPEAATTEEKVNVTCVHTSAADNGTSYLLKLLQLSFRESFCIWNTGKRVGWSCSTTVLDWPLLLVPRPHRTVMTCKCWGREVWNYMLLPTSLREGSLIQTRVAEP